MRNRKQIGVTVDPERFKIFCELLEKHGLKISPVIDALMQLFIDELERKID